MPKANEIKRGMVLEHQGGVYMVRDLERSAPTARGGNTTYRFTLYSVPGGHKVDLTLRGDDFMKETELSRRQCQFSYRDGDALVFMDNEDYTQYTLDADAVGDDADLISEGLDGIFVTLIEDAPVGIQLPQSVVLEVLETTPYLKGASATGRTKPARLSTGLEIQVPEYVVTGERVKVNTETREFAGRAS